MGWSLAWERGQSSVLGVALLFAIVITVSVSVVLIGTQALEQQERATSMEGATASFQQLDADLAQVASGSQKRVSIADIGNGEARVEGEKGNVTVQITDPDGTSPGNVCTVVGRIADTDGDGDDEVTAQPLGRVIYERGGQTLAYQGGGVFRSTAGSDDSSVVSAPSFQYQYRNGQQTLSLPLVRIDGDATGSDISLSRTGSQQRGFPSQSCLEDETSDVPDSTVPADALRNPVSEDYTVRITVRSEFYRAWGTTFEEQTGGTVNYDAGDGEVTLELSGSSSPGGETAAGPIKGALYTGSAEITNVGQIDSYRSESGGYPATASFPHRTNGDVIAVDEVNLTESPEIGGGIEAGGDLNGTNDFVVHGDTTVGGSTKIKNNGEFKGSVSVAETFEMGTGSSSSNRVTIRDDVIVGGSFEELHATTVGGSIYVNGPMMDNGRDFYVHPSGQVDGSIVASGPVDLSEAGAERDAEITGDIVSTGASVEVGDGISFDNSDSRSEIHADGSVTLTGSGVTYDADVVAGGDVTIESGVTVDGDVHAGGDIYVNGDVEDDHDVVAGGTVTGESNDGGTPRTPDSPSIPSARSPDIPSNAPAEDFIDPMRSMGVDPATADSDDDMTAIQNWGGCSPDPCDLSAGDYHLDQMELTNGDQLVIETGGDEVNIEIGSGDMVLQGGEIDVRGDGTVNITVSGGVSLENYNTGGSNLKSRIDVEDGADVNIHAQGTDADDYGFELRNSRIDVHDSDARVEIAADGGDVELGGTSVTTAPQDNASQIWIYTMPSAYIGTYGQPSITGVIYGADGSGGGTPYQLTNDVELYGAIVGESDSINSQTKIHFDESLEARTGVSGGGGGGGGGSPSERVGYLHVTTTTVTVDDR